jgi:hypothetical protein
MEPFDTSLTATLIHVDSEDEIEEGDLPISQFRYKIVFNSDALGTRTPFLDTVAISGVSALTEEEFEEGDVSDYVTSCSIRLSLDTVRREGDLTLRNDDSQFDYLLTSDASKVTVSIGDTRVFTGYATDPRKTMDGKNSEYIEVRLVDYWYRLDYNKLLPLTSFYFDNWLHNHAIWYLMR